MVGLHLLGAKARLSLVLQGIHPNLEPGRFGSGSEWFQTFEPSIKKSKKVLYRGEHQQDAMLLAVLDLVLLVLLVPLFFDLESRDLSIAIQSRTIPRARIYLGLESYAITRDPSFDLRFLVILLFKSLLRYSRHNMISSLSIFKSFSRYSLGITT